jgi:hypothetical protein
MAASADTNERRRRYTRRTGPASLTPARLQLLRYIAEYKILSLPQLARLACPSQKSARRHMRRLFDAGLVEIIPVPRAALAGPEVPNNADLLFGSAPNIYTVSRPGAKLLQDSGLTESLATAAEYGPRNSVFLSHELALRDVRVWFELTARQALDHEIVRWCDGKEAEMDLKRTRPPKSVRPDAWFVYGLCRKALVCCIEVDQGTERGTSGRWKEKLSAYQELLASGKLQEVTGFRNARILVVTVTPRRRDALAETICHGTDRAAAEQYWVACGADMLRPGLTEAIWRRPGSQGLHPLITHMALSALSRDGVTDAH